MRLSPTSNQKGFTLVELMVTVAIIGLLAALAVPKFKRFSVKARQAEPKAFFTTIHALQEVYHGENATYWIDHGLLGGKLTQALIPAIYEDCTGINEIGFRIPPSQCDKVRYHYRVEVKGTGYEIVAVAPGFLEPVMFVNSANPGIYPGCTHNDVQRFDHDRVFTHSTNVLDLCD